MVIIATSASFGLVAVGVVIAITVGAVTKANALRKTAIVATAAAPTTSGKEEKKTNGIGIRFKNV